jgi:type IV secretory pathway VirB10-like protein
MKSFQPKKKDSIMTRFTALFTAAMLGAASLSAQEKPPVTPPTTEPVPETPAEKPGEHVLELAPTPPAPLLPPPTPAPEAMPLIPEIPQAPDKPVESGAEVKKEKKDKTQAAADDLLEKIRFRQARTKALKDPKIQAEWDLAQNAKTDFEKREALENFYKRFYGKVLAIDPSLKKLVTTSQNRAVARLKQTRIDPTVAIDPDERNNRFGRD